MDRSFLSQPEVVAASRNLVCVRLATYEDAEEARFLASVFVGGSGQLENTVFAILSPDGRTPLVRSGRAPHQFYGAPHLAGFLREVASQYPSTAAVEVPRVETVRVALNVAACDHLPLIVNYCADPRRLPAREKELLGLAWSQELQGRAIFCNSSDARELARLCGKAPVGQETFLLIRPDEYGMRGSVILEGSPEQLAGRIRTYSANALPPGQHMREGFRQGIRWQTAVPVTDPGGRY